MKHETSASYYAGCAGKTAFSSASKAWGHIRKGAFMRNSSRAYRCGFCNLWHITKQK